MLTGASLSNQFAADVQSVDALRMKAVSGDPDTLRTVARQFEAMLVQSMLKTARTNPLSGEGDPFGNSNDMKLYRDLLDQQWAQKIVSGKGFGLADILVKQLTRAPAGEVVAEAATKGVPLKPEGQAVALDAQSRAVPVDMNALGNAAAQLTPQTGSGNVDADSGQASGDQAGQGDHRQRFVRAMLPHAQAAEKATGVPARFMLAQAALESGWGRHEIRAEDGSTSHNLFGIKAGSGWDGQSVSVQTTEYKQGLAMKVSAKFRSYADYAEAFLDYARLIQRRYRGAAMAGTDAQAFAGGVVAGGYATDPAYGAKLQGVIRSVARAEA